MRGSRLAAVAAGEFAFGAVRGEHLTMRGWEFAIGECAWRVPEDATATKRLVLCNLATGRVAAGHF
jgi:hypothetical protein